MEKIKIGVFGAYRGSSMINYCKRANNAEVVAICDKNPDAIEQQKKNAQGLNITYYNDFDEFIKHDMDAVVLANYANEHAPYAIRVMKAGKHVFSELLPVQTMKEAVELVETVEETGMIYAYGENFCYMSAPYEMKKLYEKGELGEFEYGECEYTYNYESIWHCITYGDESHWRNNMYSTFYCTHTIGPMIHMTGLRPVSVTGFEGGSGERHVRVGAKGGCFGIEMITLENGGIIKSIHGSMAEDSIWYCAYGSKGRVESAREDAENGGLETVHLRTGNPLNDEEKSFKTYKPVHEFADVAGDYGHGGSDYYSLYYFIEKLKGNPDGQIIDIYEALDMFLPGMFAYRSILAGGKPMKIPNLRDKKVRDLWRNDTACTDKNVAGDMLLPTSAKGTPEIGEEVYDYMKGLWAEECKNRNSIYRNAAFNQGSEKKEEEK